MDVMDYILKLHWTIPFTDVMFVMDVMDVMDVLATHLKTPFS